MVLLSFVVTCQGGSLRKNFYRHSGIRMHFHDCFVRGYDGSVLLNSTSNNTAEKDAIPNLTLAGFDVTDDIKNAVEEKCAKTVSCADILALAARDAVSAQFNKPTWELLAGRRDGTVSKSSEALANIPAPTFNFTQLKQNFASKGLTLHDLVVLSGAHTIGVGHCNSFSNRIYNFTGKGDQDPSLNSTYAAFLKTKCKSLKFRWILAALEISTVTIILTFYRKRVYFNQMLLF